MRRTERTAERAQEPEHRCASIKRTQFRIHAEQFGSLFLRDRRDPKAARRSDLTQMLEIALERAIRFVIEPTVRREAHGSRAQ